VRNLPAVGWRSAFESGVRRLFKCGMPPLHLCSGVLRGLPCSAQPPASPVMRALSESVTAVELLCRVGQCRCVGRSPRFVQLAPHLEHGAMPSKVQHHPTRVLGQLRGDLHHLLHHRLQASALGRMPQRRVLAKQRLLSDQTQEHIAQSSVEIPVGRLRAGKVEVCATICSSCAGCCRSGATSRSARVKVVVASVMQPTAAYGLPCCELLRQPCRVLG
jgi:hypothetical protein